MALTFISLGTLNLSVPNYKMGIVISTLQAVVKIKFIYLQEGYSVVQNDLMTSHRYKTLRQKEWDGIYIASPQMLRKLARPRMEDVEGTRIA